MSTWLFYAVVIGGAGLFFLVYFFLWRRISGRVAFVGGKVKGTITNLAKPGKDTGEGEEGKTREGSVEARIYDNKKRRAYNEILSGVEIETVKETYGNLGRLWLKDGKWIYALNKKIYGTYHPVIVPSTMNNPPSTVHEALTQPEIDICFNMEQEQSFMQKYWHIVLLGSAVLFMMFVLIANMMQK